MLRMAHSCRLLEGCKEGQEHSLLASLYKLSLSIYYGPAMVKYGVKGDCI